MTQYSSKSLPVNLQYGVVRKSRRSFRRGRSLIDAVQRLGSDIPNKLRLLREEGLEFVKQGWHLRVVRSRSFAAQLLDPLLNPLARTNDLHTRMLVTVA